MAKSTRHKIAAATAAEKPVSIPYAFDDALARLLGAPKQRQDANQEKDLTPTKTKRNERPTEEGGR